jgi:hypothetical protein
MAAPPIPSTAIRPKFIPHENISSGRIPQRCPPFRNCNVEGSRFHIDAEQIAQAGSIFKRSEIRLVADPDSQLDLEFALMRNP